MSEVATSSRRLWTLALVALLCWSVIATVASVYYFQQYMSVRASLVQVSVTIDYGNGMVVTHDEVYLFKDATVLDALRAVAEVNATYWPSFGAFFVESINGVINNADNNGKYWLYWVNGEHPPVGADKYVLRNGDLVEWKYVELS